MDKGNFVDIDTNQAFLRVPRPGRVLGNLVMGIRFPSDLLPLVLHEGAHHMTFLTPVATTIAAMGAETRLSFADAIQHSRGLDRSTPDRMIRYRLLLDLLQPLIEGIALFCEHDLRLGEAEVRNQFFLTLRTFVAPEVSTSFKQSDAEADERFNECVQKGRISHNGIQNKARLLHAPIDTRIRPGYLAGYLTVKHFHFLVAKAYGEYVTSEFLVEFLVAYFFCDFEFVSHILRPQPVSGLAGCHMWIRPIASYFRSRIAKFTELNRKAISAFYDSRTGKNPDQRILDWDQIANDMDAARKGAVGLQTYLATVFSRDEADAERALFSSRHVFRFGSSDITVKAKNGRVAFFGADKCPVVVGLKAINPTENIEGIGTLELFLSLPPHRHLWCSAVVMNDQLIAVHPGNPTISVTDCVEMVIGRVGSWSTVRRYLDVVADAMESAVEADDQVRIALDQWSDRFDKFYMDVAICSNQADLSDLIAKMKNDGFGRLFSSSALDRANMSYLMAAITLATTNFVDPSKLTDFLESYGVNMAEDLPKLFQVLRECEFQGLVENRKLIMLM